MENLRFLMLFDLMTDTNRVCVNLLSLSHVWALVLLSPALLFKAALLVFPKDELVDDTQGWNHLMAFKLYLWPKKIAGKLSFAHVEHFGLWFASASYVYWLLSSCIFLLVHFFSSLTPNLYAWPALFFCVKFHLLLILLVLLSHPQNDLTSFLSLLFVVQVSRKPAGSNIIITIFDIQTSEIVGKIQGWLQKQSLKSIEVCFTCFL